MPIGRGWRLGPTLDPEQALPHHREVGELDHHKPDQRNRLTPRERSTNPGHQPSRATGRRIQPPHPRRLVGLPAPPNGRPVEDELLYEPPGPFAGAQRDKVADLDVLQLGHDSFRDRATHVVRQVDRVPACTPKADLYDPGPDVLRSGVDS